MTVKVSQRGYDVYNAAYSNDWYRGIRNLVVMFTEIREPAITQFMIAIQEACLEASEAPSDCPETLYRVADMLIAMYVNGWDRYEIADMILVRVVRYVSRFAVMSLNYAAYKS